MPYATTWRMRNSWLNTVETVKNKTLAAVWRLEEMCLEMLFDGVYNKSESGRQVHDRLFHTRAAATPKCSIADGAASCTWHDQLVGGWRSQTLSGVVVSSPVQVSCQVHRRGVTMAADDECGQSELNTLRSTQPMHVMEQWSNTVELMDRSASVWRSRSQM